MTLHIALILWFILSFPLGCLLGTAMKEGSSPHVP